MSTRNRITNTLSEDTIQCFYFPTKSIGAIEILCEDINKFVVAKTKNYLWHRDSFKILLPITETLNDYPTHLVSNTCFGDNIEDEWFIVHIVMEITKHFTDLIVHLKDNDGDFLLIESANHLPSWINPETTENRVFIYRGNMHIIPPNIASLEDKLTMDNAVRCIVEFPEQTLCSREIQEDIANRIGSYPAKFDESIHNAVLEIPVSIAALLKLKPALIAPIVNAYSYHDSLDANMFKTVKYENTVLAKVKFTKCLYAMLLHSKIPRNLKSFVSSNNDMKKVMGFKVTCGFHMITDKSSNADSKKECIKFINNLSSNGYFKGNIEGTKEYNNLLDKARTYYLSVECPLNCSVSSDISQIMKTEEYESIKEILLKNTPASSELEGDSEDWLNIDPNQLNEMLNSRFGKTSMFENNDVITPENLTKELGSFLNQNSDFEGIQLNENESTDSNIEFDADDFVNCVEKMLNLLSCGNDNSGNYSDYGNSSVSDSDDENLLDDEIESKLQGRSALQFDDKSILQNIVQSMKEEHASSGPSSNLLSSVGLNKTDLLDSDDD